MSIVSNQVFPVRVRTYSEKQKLDKDWNELQAAVKMNETAVKMRMAAEIEIADKKAVIEQAGKNIESGIFIRDAGKIKMEAGLAKEQAGQLKIEEGLKGIAAGKLMLEQGLKGRDEALLEIANAQMKRKEVVAKKDEAVVKRDEAITKRDEAVANRDEAVAKKDEAIVNRDEAIAKRDEAVVKRDEAVVKRDEAVVKRNEAVVKREEAVVKRDEDLAKLKKIRESREKTRNFIIKQLDGSNTLLLNKISVINSLEGKNENIITDLQLLLAKNSLLKKEVASATSLESVQKQLPTFSQEINVVLTKIKELQLV